VRHAPQPGKFLNPFVQPLDWTPTTHDYAFRIATREHAVVTPVNPINVAPTCQPDFNNDGFVNTQDIFDFLTRWFTGCP